MKIEKLNIVKLLITDVPRHDPIHVYLEDYGDGRGRITISEYGESCTAFWPAMACSLSDFILKADNEYIIKYLDDTLKMRSQKYKFMESRLNVIRDALRELS